MRRAGNWAISGPRRDGGPASKKVCEFCCKIAGKSVKISYFLFFPVISQ
jgi:hypothetical protein